MGGDLRFVGDTGTQNLDVSFQRGDGVVEGGQDSTIFRNGLFVGGDSLVFNFGGVVKSVVEVVE